MKRRCLHACVLLASRMFWPDLLLHLLNHSPRPCHENPRSNFGTMTTRRSLCSLLLPFVVPIRQRTEVGEVDIIHVVDGDTIQAGTMLVSVAHFTFIIVVWRYLSI